LVPRGIESFGMLCPFLSFHGFRRPGDHRDRLYTLVSDCVQACVHGVQSVHGARRRGRCDGRQAGDRLARQGRVAVAGAMEGSTPHPRRLHHAAGKPMVQGQGRERLAPRGGWHPAAPGGTSTATSTATSQGTPQAPHKVPRRSCPYPASPAGCDWPVRRSRACRCDAVPGRCGGAVRRALAGPVRRGASRGAAAVPGAVQDGGAAAGGVQRLAGVRRVRCDARPGVRLAGATGGAVRRCDRPPGGGATGGARRRPPGLGLLAFG